MAHYFCSSYAVATKAAVVDAVAATPCDLCLQSDLLNYSATEVAAETGTEVAAETIAPAAAAIVERTLTHVSDQQAGQLLVDDVASAASTPAVAELDKTQTLLAQMVGNSVPDCLALLHVQDSLVVGSFGWRA
jgi:hypothetical protein